jgi:hypothetical protein
MKIRVNAEIEIVEETPEDENKLGYAFTWLGKKALTKQAENSDTTSVQNHITSDSNASFNENMHDALESFIKKYDSQENENAVNKLKNVLNTI